MHIFQKSLTCLKIPSRDPSSPASSPLLKRKLSPSSSKNYCDTNNNTDTSLITPFPLATPKKINTGKTMDRAFPQSLKKENYPQDAQTGLRSYQNENDIIIHFVFHDDLMLKDTLFGSNSPKLMTLRNQDYVYKTSLMSKQSLPKNHSRTLNNEEEYFSNSRVMMQIMSRNLLELLLKNEQNVILPNIYPVVHNDTDEICGLISKKIECDDYNSLEEKSKTKELSKDVIEDKIKLIDTKCKSIGLLTLAKIIGIDDLIIPFANIKNIGLTPDEKLVLFDFGANLLDHEKERVSLFKPDDDYDFVLFNKSLKNITDTYLKDYNTVQDGFKRDGTAKTVHPNIQKIIMDTGPGDTEFRQKLAKLIQARINNALLQAKKMENIV